MRRSFAFLGVILALGSVFLLFRQVLPVAQPAAEARTAAPGSSSTASTAIIVLPFVSRSEAPTNTPTATTGPTPTVGPTATTGPTPTDTPGTPGVTRLQAGGLGFSDTGTHQVLRTADDRVYVFAPEIYQKYIRAYRATNIGTPAGFTEADQAHQPTAQSAIWSLDAAIDGNNIVHLLYITQSGPVIYQTFSTTTDLWAPPTQVANSAWPNRNNGLRQGSEGVSLAIDAGGLAHVVYGQTQSGKRRVYYNNNQGGTWNHEVLVDDQPNSDNSHATLAFGPDGALYVAWLADDGTHGAIRVRAHRNGAWQPASAVDANVFRDQGYSIDQGPNLLVTPDGKLHVVYIGTWESVPGSPTGTEYGRLHHKYSGDGGATWTANDPPTRYTHSPALATDPQGNLYVFGHREYWKANRCANMLVNVQPAGGAWGTWKTLASGCYDSSVSAKWTQYFWNTPSVLDLVYWTEKGPQGQSDVNQLYYAEIRGGPDTINALPPAGP